MSAVTPIGLVLETRQQIYNRVADGMKSIYGEDVDLSDPNYPDAQWCQLITQIIMDQQEFAAQVYTSFDPDQAVGVALSRLVKINGVVRGAGSYTIQPVTIVFNANATLYGLDQTAQAPYAVSDTQGNTYLLQETIVNLLGPTTMVGVLFRADVFGPIKALPNTVTIQVAPVRGVATVNNPEGPVEVGVSQQTDASLRVQRAQSVAMPSKGYAQGLVGAILGLSGVTEAKVFENKTSVVDVNGIPAHGIWTVVEGGDPDEIALAIAIKRNGGCNMKGDISIPITMPQSQIVDILFSRPIYKPLYISLVAVAIPGTSAVDIDWLRDQIMQRFGPGGDQEYSINQPCDTSEIVKYIKTIAPGYSVSQEVASGDDFVSEGNLIYPSLDGDTPIPPAVPLVSGKFVLAPERIYINIV